MLNRFRGNFITGIIVILPIAITLWVLRIIYRMINDGMLNPLLKLLRPYLTSNYLEYGAKAIIFVLLIMIVMLIGLGTRILFIRKVFSAGEKLFFKIPMIGRVYVAIKQISKAFLGGRKGVFKAPVLVEYPRRGVYSIGFLTSETMGEIQQKTKKKLLNIFVPTTPNPTSGILLLTPEDEITRLNMSVEEAMKLVVSGGMVVPPETPQNEG